MQAPLVPPSVCGYSLVVGCDLPKVETRVRFPVPAQNANVRAIALALLHFVVGAGNRRPRRGREYLIDFERSEEIYLVTCDRERYPHKIIL